MPILYVALCAVAFFGFAYRMNRQRARGESSQLNWLLMVLWASAGVTFFVLALYSWAAVNRLPGFGK